jgi:4-hydroxybenzoate polyprenyltransferase
MSFGDYVKSRLMILGGGFLLAFGLLMLLFAILSPFYLVFAIPSLILGAWSCTKGSYLKKKVEPRGVYRRKEEK